MLIKVVWVVLDDSLVHYYEHQSIGSLQMVNLAQLRIQKISLQPKSKPFSNVFIVVVTCFKRELVGFYSSCAYLVE